MSERKLVPGRYRASFKHASFKHNNMVVVVDEHGAWVHYDARHGESASSARFSLDDPLFDKVVLEPAPLREKTITIRLHPGSGFIAEVGTDRVWAASTKQALSDWIYKYLPFGDWQLTIVDRCSPGAAITRVEDLHHEYVQ